jgi:segregation and condensation protein B
MQDDHLTRALEAVLLVAVEPVTPSLLAELVEEPVERVELVCAALAASYEAANSGIVLARVAGGYRLQTHPDLAPYVERFANREVSTRLSTAALETLAIIAYRQPISRAQIAALRGVNADGVVRLLEQRGYVREVGRASGPGQAALFGTTELFLERLGLDTLEQLPPVETFLPSADVAGELEERFRPGVAPANESI